MEAKVVEENMHYEMLENQISQIASLYEKQHYGSYGVSEDEVEFGMHDTLPIEEPMDTPQPEVNDAMHKEDKQEKVMMEASGVGVVESGILSTFKHQGNIMKVAEEKVFEVKIYKDPFLSQQLPTSFNEIKVMINHQLDGEEVKGEIDSLKVSKNERWKMKPFRFKPKKKGAVNFYPYPP